MRALHGSAGDKPTMKVLVDADLILELFIGRPGLVEAAEQLHKMMQYHQVELFITDRSLVDIHFYLSRLVEQFGDDAFPRLEVMFDGHVIHIEYEIIEKARTFPLLEFNAAVECACACAMNIGAIVTQNRKKFDGANLPILLVEELLERRRLEKSFDDSVLSVWAVEDFAGLQNLLSKFESNQVSDLVESSLVSDLGADLRSYPTQKHRRSVDYSLKWQNFLSELQELLDPESPSGLSLSVFLENKLRQFHLNRLYDHADILSEVLLRAHKLIHSEGVTVLQISAWTKKTAFNVIRELSRKEQKSTSLTENLLDKIDYTAGSDKLVEDDFLAINQAMKMLDSEEQRLLQLKLVECLSWRDISEIFRDEGYDYKEAALRKKKERSLSKLRYYYAFV
jgi:hypothetical protein